MKTNLEPDDEEKMTLRLPKKLKDDLNSHCKANDLSASAFVRKALSAALYGKEQPSTTEILSTNNLQNQIEQEKKEIERLKAYLDLLTLKEEKTKLLEQVEKKTKTFGGK